jgi:hypothetical protein
MRSRPLVLALSFFGALTAARTTHAGPCPTVMLILDRSGSMDEDPSGGTSSPSKLDIAKMTLDKLVMQYGDRLPFGFTTFESSGLDCATGVDVQVKPVDGTKAMITSAVNAVMTGGSTNTGPAIDAVAALPEMHDMTRPGSYILLITDGEPNCPGHVGTESSDPAYTIGAIARAATKGIKTFVVGFGALPTADQMAMNQMAMAGGEPCTGAACNGQMFYAAESDASLQAAIDSISQQIFGEFGGLCDDSCYANGCPNAGEICVNNACKLDPCLSVRPTCAPGDYCYTDGNSPGTCTPSCPQTCPPGQACTLSGCAPDVCAGVVCDSMSECKGGVCAPLTCKDCPANLFCVDGQCKDDPCRFIVCPQGATCQTLKGTCVSGAGDGSGAHRNRQSGGCHFTPGAHPDKMMWLSALLLGAAALVLRRTRRSGR